MRRAQGAERLGRRLAAGLALAVLALSVPAGVRALAGDPAAAPGAPPKPLRLSETGLYAADGSVDPANRPFAPQYSLWTDGASKARWVFLPEGAKIDVTDLDAWRFPAGTKLWKEFAWGGRRVETRLIWQPAEETGRGAVAAIEAGMVEGVDMIFGGHLDRHYLPGQLAVDNGIVNAATDHFVIEIDGQEGHGARPHEALDAVVVGSLFVTALQTIVSREVDPAHPSVVSVGTFNAGSAANVIAGHAKLSGTIRSQDESVRVHLQRSIERIAKSVGTLHGAKVRFELLEGTPPLINNGPPVSLAQKAARRVVGHSQVVPLRTANMGGEDFAHYLEHIPGC